MEGRRQMNCPACIRSFAGRSGLAPSSGGHIVKAEVVWAAVPRLRLVVRALELVLLTAATGLGLQIVAFLTAASLLLLLATLAALRISTTRHSRNRVRLFPLLLGSLVIRGTQFIPTRRKLRLGLVQAWHSAQLPSGLFFSISQALVSVGNIQHFLLGLMLA